MIIALLSNYYLLIDNVGCSCNHIVLYKYGVNNLYGVTSYDMRAGIDLVIVILLGTESMI